MTDIPIAQRKFTDEEVQAILKKAVEKTSSHAVARTGTPGEGADEGLSLEDLKAIGQEVGIDPSRLEDAARAVVARQAGPAGGLLGGATRWHFERTVKGTLDPDDTPEVLSVIRRVMAHHGKVSQVHGSLEWSHSGESGSRHVTVSSRDGTTTIHAAANLAQLALVTYLPAGILSAFASAVTFVASAEAGSALGMAFGAALFPTAVGVMRTVFRRLSRREATRLQQVADELARLPEGDGA